jgi:hypothetical protein
MALVIAENSSQDNCGVCGGPENDKMLSCDHCSRWFDYECVDLVEEEVDKIEYFYCLTCEDLDELDLLTTWGGRKASARERADKHKNAPTAYATLLEELPGRLAQL